MMEASRRDIRDVIRASRHARTTVLTLPDELGTRRAYFKLYRPASWKERAKDLFRASRARRALCLSTALTADGFGVPLVLAAGEQRRGRLLRRAFLLTAEVATPTLRQVPDALAGEPPRGRVRLKRALLAVIGTEVGRFHRLGYIHGDLVVTNVMVRWHPATQVFFLDHDRTRCGWAWMRRHRQRRNLVQLNRHRLAGVSNSDRFRVFRSYAAARGWDRDRIRREARWIARRTVVARRGMRPPAPSGGSPGDGKGP